MKPNYLYYLAAITGVAAGFASTHILLIGWYNLFFWGIVGVGIGRLCQDKRTLIRAGALYGFFLSISFLFSGFQGTQDKFLGFAVFSLGLSIVGALGGIIVIYIGHRVGEYR